MSPRPRKRRYAGPLPGRLRRTLPDGDCAHRGGGAPPHCFTEFDLIFINAPLPDEFGVEFSQYAAGQTSAGVLLLVKAEIADDVAAKVERDGVLVLSKPGSATP